jgi:hypothetical protein
MRFLEPLALFNITIGFLLWFICAHLDPDPANQNQCGSTPLGITKSFCPPGQDIFFHCRLFIVGGT